MAITKIHPIKTTLKKAIDYICNPDKTDEKMLISSFGCEPETADIEFKFTNSQSIGNKGNNLAHHLIQAFEPGEVSFEKAHQIGQELAEAVLQGKYEYVLTTHIDKGHVHNHIIFCATNFVDHHKYVSNKRSLYGIRRTSDRLCRAHNLTTIIPGKGQDNGLIEYTDKNGERQHRPAQGRAKSFEEINAEKRGVSWKSKLREAIDEYIKTSFDWDDFLHKMEVAGYTIKRAKYHSYKALGQERFIGGPTLGAEYTDERIKERIAGLSVVPKRKKIQFADDKKINLIIDIESSIKAQQSAGYAHWAKLHNLKEAAKTVLFLQENNIVQYEQLSAKIAEIQVLFDNTHATLKGAEKRLSDLSLLIKNIENFNRTLSAYRAYRQAKDPDKIFRQHESKIIIHEAARKALKGRGIEGKLPDVTALKQEHESLTKEKAALYQQYSGLKKQIKEYSLIKANIDTILGERAAAQDKNIEHIPAK
jgi:hypothetical protein